MSYFITVSVRNMESMDGIEDVNKTYRNSQLLHDRKERATCPAMVSRGYFDMICARRPKPGCCCFQSSTGF
jgi:hypothetical protein